MPLHCAPDVEIAVAGVPAAATLILGRDGEGRGIWVEIGGKFSTELQGWRISCMDLLGTPLEYAPRTCT